MTRRILALTAVFFIGFALGYWAHKPKPEWVVDVYPGDVSIDQLMYAGKVHAHFQCPRWYTVDAKEGEEPECRFTAAWWHP